MGTAWSCSGPCPQKSRPTKSSHAATSGQPYNTLGAGHVMFALHRSKQVAALRARPKKIFHAATSSQLSIIHHYCVTGVPSKVVCSVTSALYRAWSCSGLCPQKPKPMDSSKEAILGQLCNSFRTQHSASESCDLAVHTAAATSILDMLVVTCQGIRASAACLPYSRSWPGRLPCHLESLAASHILSVMLSCIFHVRHTTWMSAFCDAVQVGSSSCGVYNHLLGHEGEGSVIALLNKQCYSESLQGLEHW